MERNLLTVRGLRVQAFPIAISLDLNGSPESRSGAIQRHAMRVVCLSKLPIPSGPEDDWNCGMIVAKRVYYEGRVQGVGFRYSIKSITTGFEVIGWVKNLIDGRVELVVQGEESEVNAFLKAVLDGQLRRYIRRFVAQDIPVKGDIKGFQITH